MIRPYGRINLSMFINLQDYKYYTIAVDDEPESRLYLSDPNDTEALLTALSRFVWWDPTCGSHDRLLVKSWDGWTVLDIRKMIWTPRKYYV